MTGNGARQRRRPTLSELAPLSSCASLDSRGTCVHSSEQSPFLLIALDSPVCVGLLFSAVAFEM